MLSIKRPGGTEYALPVLTGEALTALSSWYDNRRADGFADPVRPSAQAPLPPRRLGSLYWPVVGATRFAIGTFVVDSWTLAKLRADAEDDDMLDEAGRSISSESGSAITEESSQANAVVLCYRDDPDDADEVAREFPLYLLSARAVSETGAASSATATAPDVDDAYIITLVDRRWYWQYSAGAGVAITDAPLTWGQLLTTLLTALPGAGAVSIDAVSASYHIPSDIWKEEWQYTRGTAVMLDDAARRLNLRLVVTPEGMSLQAPTAANRNAAVDWLAEQADAGRFGGGGSYIADDTEASLPAGVATVWADGTTSAASLSGSLGTLYAPVDLPGRATAAERDAALSQWAADWYSWQDAPFDVVINGFVYPPLSGYVGSIELYHDSKTGYSRVSPVPLDWTPNEDARPETGFPAQIASTWSAATGYAWNRLILRVLPATPGFSVMAGPGEGGVDAWPLNDDRTLLPGTQVWMYPNPNGDGYVIERTNLPVYGCNLTYTSATNTLSVDVASLAGPGLSVYGSGPCYSLTINPVTFGPYLGCGLSVDSGLIGLDLTDVVNGGLVWNADDCTLEVKPGCGLFLDSTDLPFDTIAVDYEQIAGDNAETALTVRLIADECSELAVDLDSVTETYEDLVNDVSIALVGGLLRLTKKKTRYTNYFNAAGLHIDRTAGTQITSYQTIDPCLFAECCAAGTFSVGVVVTQPDPAVCCFDFDSTVTGGVAPYSYEWDFGDGTGATEADPTYCYADNATHTVTLTVTDACGRTATWTDDEPCAGSGSGGGGGCGAVPYTDKIASFTGDLSALGDITLTYNGGESGIWSWMGTAAVSCGTVDSVTLTDNHDCTYTVVVAASDTASSWTWDVSTGIAYDPFDFTSDDTPTLLGSCAAALPNPVVHIHE